MEVAVAQRTWEIRSGADFGRTIADIRSERGLTQSDLADLAVVDRSYLAKIETGRTVSLLEHILRLLRRLGATITITIEDPRGR